MYLKGSPSPRSLTSFFFSFCLLPPANRRPSSGRVEGFTAFAQLGVFACPLCVSRSDPDDVKDMIAAVSAIQNGICGSTHGNDAHRVDPAEAFKRNSASAQKLRTYFESRNARVMFGDRSARLRSNAS